MPRRGEDSLVARLPRQLRRGGPDERGAVLVEAAFVFPVLALLVFGIIEFGFIFKDSLTLSNMTRSGARTGAAAGNNNQTDYSILMAVKGASGALGSTLQGVIIYKASATNGNVPSGCTIGGSSVSGVCNVYTPTEIQNLQTTWTTQLSSYPNSFGCASGAWDAAWCPTTRVVSQTSGPDYLGVYVKALHANLTGFFSSLTLSDASVMRLEPQSL